jgi:hypothetical protein
MKVTILGDVPDPFYILDEWERVKHDDYRRAYEPSVNKYVRTMQKMLSTNLNARRPSFIVTRTSIRLYSTIPLDEERVRE